DRILGGEQLAVDGVDAAQAGVQGRGLAGTGGAGVNEDAVRLGEGFGNVVVQEGRHARLFEVEVDRAAVEHAQHDRLAVLGGQGVDAHVDRLAVDGGHDATVLRDAPLGDVHVRHDLDARDDAVGQVHGWRRHFVERAVDAVADLELV